MAKEKLDLRTTFLKTFLQRLIEKTHVPKKTIPQKKNQQEYLESKTKKPIKIPRRLPHIVRQKMPNIPKPKKEPLPQTLLEQKPVPPSQNLQQTPINLGKVTQFLKDPAVLSVEVPGPNKNVLVNRSGAVQTTPLTLSKQEIETIMNEVSDKTRIPITTGLFKAAFQDLVMTAVISEFVGARFMLQKMNPFQKSY